MRSAHSSSLIHFIVSLDGRSSLNPPSRFMVTLEVEATDIFTRKDGRALTQLAEMCAMHLPTFPFNPE